MRILDDDLKDMVQSITTSKDKEEYIAKMRILDDEIKAVIKHITRSKEEEESIAKIREYLDVIKDEITYETKDGIVKAIKKENINGAVVTGAFIMVGIEVAGLTLGEELGGIVNIE